MGCLHLRGAPEPAVACAGPAEPWQHVQPALEEILRLQQRHNTTRGTLAALQSELQAAVKAREAATSASAALQARGPQHAAILLGPLPVHLPCLAASQGCCTSIQADWLHMHLSAAAHASALAGGRPGSICAQARLSAAEERIARLDWSSREQAAALQRAVRS